MTSSDDPRFGSPQWLAPVTDLDKFRQEKERQRKIAEAEAAGPDAEIIPLLPDSGWESMPDATPITADTADPVTELRAVDHVRYVTEQLTEEEAWNEENRPSHPYYPQKHPYYPHPSEASPTDPPMRGYPPSSPPSASPPMPGPPAQKGLPKKGPKTPKPPGAK
jgi:hypothetical protein